jgi:putative hemolysin
MHGKKTYHCVMSEEEKIPQIDVEEIIGSKNPTLLKLLPGFVLSYIKKILHQADVNDFLKKHHQSYGLDFVRAVIQEFELKITCSGLHNVPETGGCVIVSNHPLGGLDALPLMQEVGKVRTDLKFLVNDVLMSLENLRPVFVPVNKLGKNAGAAIQRISDTYASEAVTLIFPAGLVSRKQNGVVKDLDWHKSFITQSVKYQRNIIPVFIDAFNSDFFYNLGLWRKRLGLKVNIEMFFLVNEMYKQRNKSINITFGELIPYTTFTKDHSDRYWAKEVRRRVYDLGHKNR